MNTELTETQGESEAEPGYRRRRIPLVPIAIALYAGILFGCVDRLPLWVDEILQLLGTRDQSTGDLLQWIRINPGNAPLGYLVQQGVIHFAGFSVLTARLPAIVFGLLSCLCLVMLIRELRLPSGLLSVVLFMVVPLHFRYALEARPYSQALFIMVPGFQTKQ